jgi:hypothetical protein
MNNGLIALVCVLVAAITGSPSTAAPQQTGEPLEKLAWLRGCWSGGEGDRHLDEQWMKPRGGTMMGMSRTVAGGKTVDAETMVIRQTGPAIAFIAKPARQPEATFTMASLGDNEVRFENPAHDFPQRITYRLTPDGSLHARIEGTRNGQVRGVDYRMKRTEC